MHFADPYIDPATGILRNRLGLTTQAELDHAEAELISIRTTWMLESPPPNTGDLDQLRAIHRILFGPLYDWAGEIRTVEMNKGEAGSTLFQIAETIPTGAAWAHDRLAEDGMFAGMDADRFLERFPAHYDAFNYVHPFREGNGRTQRVFWSCICHAAGFDIDWRMISKADNDRASMIAMNNLDYGPLRAMIAPALSRCDPDEPMDPDRMGALHPAAAPRAGVVHVRGYYRADGTWVGPHERSLPNR